MIYTELTAADLDGTLPLAYGLWPNEDPELLRHHFHNILHHDRWHTILCKGDDGNPIGFINLSIRQDYVEGSDSSPVGYIEGIYVAPEYRHQGIARKFVELGEEWSRRNGCREYASDTELHNTDSQAFHNKVGFDTTEMIVHFIKKIV